MVVYRLCQCSLFKQFTTNSAQELNHIWLFIDYVNVLFSSNSQRPKLCSTHQSGCLSIMSMFSFQAIHNLRGERSARPPSCLSIMSMFSFQAIHNGVEEFVQQGGVVYRLCQCSLFKQFTTYEVRPTHAGWLFIDYVNVLFSSNSQPVISKGKNTRSCLSIMSMFSFQAIHNLQEHHRVCLMVVYRLCQCSLFKQFTTEPPAVTERCMLFIDYVNVLFSSNSQLSVFSTTEKMCCLSIMSMFSFQAIHN